MQIETPNILVPTHGIGTPFAGGFYGGQISSHRGAKRFAVVWAPKATGETKLPWRKKGHVVSGANSYWHSMDNTLAMARAGSPMAEWALAQRVAGHDDWCIPARDVLELGHRYLKPITGKFGRYHRDGENPSSIPPGYAYTRDDASVQSMAADFCAGGVEAFESTWYWSSTQYSDVEAWEQFFIYGYQGPIGQDATGHVRLVRLIQLNA